MTAVIAGSLAAHGAGVTTAIALVCQDVQADRALSDVTVDDCLRVGNWGHGGNGQSLYW